MLLLELPFALATSTLGGGYGAAWVEVAVDEAEAAEIAVAEALEAVVAGVLVVP